MDTNVSRRPCPRLPITGRTIEIDIKLVRSPFLEFEQVFNVRTQFSIYWFVGIVYGAMERSLLIFRKYRTAESAYLHAVTYRRYLYSKTINLFFLRIRFKFDSILIQIIDQSREKNRIKMYSEGEKILLILETEERERGIDRAPFRERSVLLCGYDVNLD